jgi:hypothetical protein
MADISERKRPTSFHSLPPEIQHHIFEYIYPTWHFEYAQVYEEEDRGSEADKRAAANQMAVGFTSTPHIVNLPSIAPLLACKAFHKAGRPVFDSSYNGQIHVVSRMILKEVKWKYACIMAKATTLTVNAPDLKTLHKFEILDRLSNLKKIVVMPSTIKHLSSFKFSYHDETYNTEMIRAPDQLRLEGAENAVYLPKHLDSEPQLNCRVSMLLRHTFHMGSSIGRVLSEKNIKTICRAVIELPVLPEYASQGVAVFIVSGFTDRHDRWNDCR